MPDAALESDVLPGPVNSLVRSLHVAAPARERYGFPSSAFGMTGRVLKLDFTEAQRISDAMNAGRDLEARPHDRVQPGLLGAAIILHELMHAVMSLHAMGDVVLLAIRERFGVADVDASLTRFLMRFPPPDVVGGMEGLAAYLEIADGDNRVASCEELVILALALENRALASMFELFDPGPLADEPGFVGSRDAALAALAGTRVERSAGPDVGAGSMAEAAPLSLLDLLAAPQRRHPDSLFDQLLAAIELWGADLRERYGWLLDRALRGVDHLREERPPAPAHSGPPPPAAGWADGFEDDASAAYSSDRDWMPRVAMVTKNALVWLVQLSRRHGRRIERLDQVPDTELDELAANGFNALWLVGVWQRSQASKTIKRLRGQPFAEASAYAIDEYRVADELGGEEALDALSAAAWRRGIRLASDMVPNHTGLDARWVVEHPERFVQLDEPPFPGYSFDGPDVSGDPRVQVRIEDGYYDGSDAAVVFQVREAATGRVRYPYHGNDGTLMPWNDTAQLDYARADVRQAVIETIVEVARRFPIIRFDAAMTLVRRHVRRLWHPAPGEGGAIASRSRHAMSGSAFDATMPREFWREVVEAIAARAPDTLLLAEAFWLMESYFVRSLGMHRVYNSAFMHMLASEDTVGYRDLVKETLAFDPRILERFVNYLTNPDEESAKERFGDGDKYFGAATVLATMPGLPLFGHGQVEGLGEKYGMEFRAPRLDEEPSEQFVARHRREIAPLLHDRESFASAARFRLFRVRSFESGGGEAHDVLAYGFVADGTVADGTVADGMDSDGRGACLVAFNNSPVAVSCAVAECEPFTAEEAGAGASTSLAMPLLAALGVTVRSGWRVVAERHPTGEVVAWDAERLAAEGLRLNLAPYEYRVYRRVRGAPIEEEAEVEPLPATERSSRTRRPTRTPVLAGPYGSGPRRAAARRRRNP